MRVVVDPRIYSAERLKRGYQREPNAPHVVLGNPMQAALLRSLGAQVQYFEWPASLEERRRTYSSWVDLCNKPLFVEVESPLAAVRGALSFDYSVLLYPKRDAALLWMNRWLTETKPAPEEQLVPMSEERLFRGAVLSRLGPIANAPRTTWPSVLRRTAKELSQVARDCYEVAGAHLERVRAKKPVLYFRAPREVGHRAELEKRWTALTLRKPGLVRALPSAWVPRVRTLELVAERAAAHPLGRPYGFYASQMVDELEEGLIDFLNEIVRMVATQPDAFLLSASGNMLTVAMNAIGYQHRPVGVVQHASFAFLRSRRTDEDALYSPNYFCWYRDPAKYLAPEVASHAVYVGYPKDPQTFDLKSAIPGRVLIAPAQKFCLFDGIHWEALTKLRSLLGEEAVNMRLHSKDDKMGFFGEPSRSLEQDLREAQVVITDMSTIAVDAAAMGRPAVVLDLFNEPNFYRDQKMFPTYRTVEEVADETKRLLSDRQLYARDVEYQRRRFEEEVGLVDGETLIETITERLRR